MKRIFTIAAAATMILGSCVQGDREQVAPVAPGESVNKNLKLTFTAPDAFQNGDGKTRQMTTAQEDGIHDLWVLVFDSGTSNDLANTDRLTAVLEADGPFSVSPTNGEATVNLAVPTGTYKTDGNFTRFVVVTNVGDDFKTTAPGNTLTAGAGTGDTYAQVMEKLSYGYNGTDPFDTADEKSAGIPMWGERTDQRAEAMTASSTTIGGTFSLRRAYARVDIGVGTMQGAGADDRTWNNATTNVPFRITGVSVYRANNRYSLMGKLANYTATPPSPLALSIPSTAAALAAGSANSAWYAADATQTYVVRNAYIPEAQLSTGTSGDSNHANRMALIVKGTYDNNKDGNFTNDGGDTYYRVDFKKGTPNALTDIVRNHTYSFSIKGVSGDGEATADDAYNSKAFNMTVDVIDWDNDLLGDVMFDGKNYFGMTSSEVTMPWNQTTSLTDASTKSVTIKTNMSSFTLTSGSIVLQSSSAGTAVDGTNNVTNARIKYDLVKGATDSNGQTTYTLYFAPTASNTAAGDIVQEWTVTAENSTGGELTGAKFIVHHTSGSMPEGEGTTIGYAGTFFDAHGNIMAAAGQGDNPTLAADASQRIPFSIVGNAVASVTVSYPDATQTGWLVLYNEDGASFSTGAWTKANRVLRNFSVRPFMQSIDDKAKLYRQATITVTPLSGAAKVYNITQSSCGWNPTLDELDPLIGGVNNAPGWSGASTKNFTVTTDSKVIVTVRRTTGGEKTIHTAAITRTGVGSKDFDLNFPANTSATVRAAGYEVWVSSDGILGYNAPANATAPYTTPAGEVYSRHSVVSSQFVRNSGTANGAVGAGTINLGSGTANDSSTGGDILYIDGATIKVGQWGTRNAPGVDISELDQLAFFKYGSLVGFPNYTDNHAINGTPLPWSKRTVTFDPNYSTNQNRVGWGTYANVPYNSSAADISAAYHSANRLNGMGDPCRLAGFVPGFDDIASYDSGWRLPTEQETYYFVLGAPTGNLSTGYDPNAGGAWTAASPGVGRFTTPHTVSLIGDPEYPNDPVKRLNSINYVDNANTNPIKQPTLPGAGGRNGLTGEGYIDFQGIRGCYWINSVVEDGVRHSPYLSVSTNTTGVQNSYVESRNTGQNVRCVTDAVPAWKTVTRTAVPTKTTDGCFILYFAQNSPGIYANNRFLSIGRWSTKDQVDAGKAHFSRIDQVALFKYGSVIGVSNPLWIYSGRDNYDPGDVLFNPSTSVTPTADWESIPNQSAKVVHTVASVKAGMGDPCRLAGYYDWEIRDKLNKNQIPDNGQWRLPTAKENAMFLGDPKGMAWNLGDASYLVFPSSDDYKVGRMDEQGVIVTTPRDNTIWVDAQSNTNSIGYAKFPNSKTTTNALLPATGCREPNGEQASQGFVADYLSSDWDSTAEEAYYITARNSQVAIDGYYNTLAFAVRCVPQ